MKIVGLLVFGSAKVRKKIENTKNEGCEACKNPLRNLTEMLRNTE